MIEERNEQVRANDVQVGHMLDLYADPYADPDKSPEYGLEFELALVGGVRVTAPGIVTIYTDQINFDCPADHLLELRGFDPDCEEF
jgi:hypothetical protein